jgi:hypothetical protein
MSISLCACVVGLLLGLSADRHQHHCPGTASVAPRDKCRVVSLCLSLSLSVYQQSPAQPALERLVRQLFVSLAELSTLGVSAAALFTPSRQLL